MDILSLIGCFQPLVATVTMRHFSLILPAILTMTGRVTMLGISRWTDKGGSYRTVQRFFATRLEWNQLLVKFFLTHLLSPAHEFIVAGDATTVTKSGSLTHGIGRFFSGLVGQVVKGLEFFVLSVVDVTRRKSYPLAVKQTVRSEAEKAEIKRRKKKRPKKSKKSPEKPRGRKPGSVNRDKNELKLSPELWRINEMLSGLLKLLRKSVALSYLAMDGHFGHHQAVLMARANDLHLISKLRRDAVLFEKYKGKYSGRGPKRKYGTRLRYDLLPTKYLKHSEQEGEIITNYYEGIFLHKEFGSELKVVMIVKINLKTRKLGHAILFSSDVELNWEKLVDYYSLRFQIEFNFRDAKQHFGFEDFMNTTETGVKNAANLAFLMVQVSAKMIENSEAKWAGVLDLKTHFRGVKYALETIKILQEKAEGILIEEAIEEVTERISKLGSIHPPKVAISTA
jgi:putative transposase